MKPTIKPARPRFSSGPCAKRPGWKPEILATEALGRSHRSDVGKRKLAEAIDRSREILRIPNDYRLGIVPGSDTGAMEIAMWSLLGPRGVDILVWESFSAGWATDIIDHLELEDIGVIKAPYGQLPDLEQVDCDRDVVFVWNGTTSGVRVPDRDWIDPAREGLTICDATSAAFAMDLPWGRLDVVTWSWQKCLGGEGGHGMIALSPRAVARLETHTPEWPLPKVFRMTKKGTLIEGIFTGSTINTPSMLCVEDWLDALRWAESIGGLPELVARAEKNLGVIIDWVDDSEDFVFLAEDPATRSCTSVCLKITAPWFIALDPEQQRAAVKRMTALLAEEEVAFDIAGYRDAPPGLRVWAGPTIETEDLVRLLPWLDWALQQTAD